MATVAAYTLRHHLSALFGDIVRGTATTTAAGSFTDTAQRKERDSFWVGAYAKFYSSATAAVYAAINERRITTSVSSTGVQTVESNWTTTPGTTDPYEIHRLMRAEDYDRFIATALRHLSRTHRLLRMEADISLAWVADQFDYAIPTEFAAIQNIEIATETGSPDTDEYEHVPFDRWHIRKDETAGTNLLVFSKDYGQETATSKIRITGYGEFAIPVSDATTYNLDPEPVIARAAYLCCRSLASRDPSGRWMQMLPDFRDDSQLMRTEMPQMRPGDVRWVEQV